MSDSDNEPGCGVLLFFLIIGAIFFVSLIASIKTVWEALP
jgi:hypothetical protein